MRTLIDRWGGTVLSRMRLLLAFAAVVLLSVSCGSDYGGGGGMGYAPGVFSLTAPANNAMGVTTTPALSWTDSLYATAYRVQISTTSDFANIVNDTGGITTTSYTVSPALAPGTYFWRVIASSAYGTYTAGPFSFTT